MDSSNLSGNVCAGDVAGGRDKLTSWLPPFHGMVVGACDDGMHDYLQFCAVVSGVVVVVVAEGSRVRLSSGAVDSLLEP